MTDTDCELEDELRNLLNRVLSRQLEGMEATVGDLSKEVSSLSSKCENFPGLPGKLKDALSKANEALADQTKAQLEALDKQFLDARAHVTAARDTLSAQFKAQAETSAQDVTKSIVSSLEAAQQSAETRGQSLADAMARLAHSIDEKTAAQQTRLGELEGKIGFLRMLSITTLAILSVTASGATALYVLAHMTHP